MTNLLTKLDNIGYCILPELINPNEAREMQKCVLNLLEKCAQELGVSLPHYLSSVSRWADPSPITKPFTQTVSNMLQPQLEQYLNTKLTLSKMNVILKSPNAPSPTPCHQDISYTPNAPYDFSCWLALTDIDLTDAPLTLLPKSHLDPILPAIDFWKTDFVDNMRNSKNWQLNSISCPIKSGSAIIFDSRIWHGSTPLTSPNIRIALVTRWKTSHRTNTKYNIPAIKKEGFGMWTSGEQTHNFFSRILKFPTSTSLTTLIDKYLETFYLTSYAKKALYQLKILHLACEKHNGGDTQGEVYKNIWKYIMSVHTDQKMELQPNLENENVDG